MENDYVLTPCGNLGGKTSVTLETKHLGEFTSTDDALLFVKEHMEKERYYPNIWWVSDHGNYWMINLEGNEIKEEEEEED